MRFRHLSGEKRTAPLTDTTQLPLPTMARLGLLALSLCCTAAALVAPPATRPYDRLTGVSVYRPTTASAPLPLPLAGEFEARTVLVLMRSFG